jgi:hypothetical protein
MRREKNTRAAHFPRLLCALALIALLNSCAGVTADITIRADGSGKIALEYRLSRMAEALGKLDGNERWPTVPAGRADFERGLARVNGLRLASFAARDDGAAVVYKAALEFDNAGALLAFLDYSGERAALTRENGANRLSLTLSDGVTDADPDLLALLRELSAGYTIGVGLEAPKAAALSLYDGTGAPLAPGDVPAARLVPAGKKVSFSIGTGELLSLPNGLQMEIVW